LEKEFRNHLTQQGIEHHRIIEQNTKAMLMNAQSLKKLLEFLQNKK
jgi:hypothetical protein